MAKNKVIQEVCGDICPCCMTILEYGECGPFCGGECTVSESAIEDWQIDGMPVLSIVEDDDEHFGHKCIVCCYGNLPGTRLTAVLTIFERTWKPLSAN